MNALKVADVDASGMYCTSLHVSRIFGVNQWARNKGCDLHQGQKYSKSQLPTETWGIRAGIIAI